MPDRSARPQAPPPGAPRGAQPRWLLAAPFFHRLVSAMFLRSAVYEEIAADRHATRQGAAVVCLSAIAQPTALSLLLFQTIGAWALLVLMSFGVLRWFIFAAIAYGVGRLIAGGGTPYGRLLRCLGFAAAPGILNALVFLLPYMGPIRFAVGLWLFAATIIAIRAALRLSLGRALAIGLVSFAVDFSVHVLVNLLTGII